VWPLIGFITDFIKRIVFSVHLRFAKKIAELPPCPRWWRDGRLDYPIYEKYILKFGSASCRSLKMALKWLFKS
jgi:hypothetical protein